MPLQELLLLHFLRPERLVAIALTEQPSWSLNELSGNGTGARGSIAPSNRLDREVLSQLCSFVHLGPACAAASHRLEHARTALLLHCSPL